MVRLACLLFMAIAQPGPNTPPPTSSVNLFGQTPVTAMTGNGRLTATLDAHGRLAGLRWPSPGHFEHASVGGQGDAMRALTWGVDDGKTLHWADSEAGVQRYRSPDSPIVENESHAGPYRLRQASFVHPALDVLVLRLTVEGEVDPERLVTVWRPAPTSRLLAESPMVVPVPGLALSFVEDSVVYTLKPEDSSAATRDWLERTAAAWPTRETRPISGPGIWLGMGTAPATATAGLTSRGSGARAHEQALVGQADAWLEVTPARVADGWEAWVFIAAGRSRQEVDQALERVQSRPERLEELVADYWRLRLAPAALPGPPGSAEAALAQRALLTLLMLQDLGSGAILRAPLARPPLARVRPMDSVWASHALAEAGYTAEAQRHLRFLATAMRDGRGRTHDGSFAEAYHADGSEAMPGAILDVDHGAWFLWACRAMAGRLPDPQDGEFLEAMWGPVQRAADFVHGWWDPVRRRPLASFDPTHLRDRARPEQLLTAYGALDSALAMAAHLGHTREAWVSRRAELRSLIDYHLVDETGGWRLAEPVALWPMDAFDLRQAMWDPAIERQQQVLLTGHAIETAQAAHFLARVAASRQQAIDTPLAVPLASAVTGSPYAFEGIEGGLWPDSLVAAHVYLALMQASTEPAAP